MTFRQKYLCLCLGCAIRECCVALAHHPIALIRLRVDKAPEWFDRKWLTLCEMSSITTQFELRGSSIDLKTRADLSAALVNRLMKRTYLVVAEHEKEYQHEIANHFRDYKHLTLSSKQKRRRKRVEVRDRVVQREILQIPCFAFPR